MRDASDSVELRRRRLIWRANHRGMKELDLTLGEFASEHVPAMEIEELEEFAKLIANEDNDLFQWLIARMPVPACADSQIMRAWLYAARHRMKLPVGNET